MKKLFCSMAVLLILVLFTNNVVFAKLTVLPPKLMIKCSNLIIVGKVMSFERNNDKVITRIHILRIIKGKTSKKEITLVYKTNVMYGLIAKFAPKVKVAMLLLVDGYYTADKNSVGIINNGKLRLLDGNPVGNYSEKDFEQEYEKLLNKR